MPTLQAIREQRAAKIDALRAIHATAAGASRDLNEQEQSAFDAGRVEVERLDREVRNVEFLADMERRAEAEPVTGTRDAAEVERRFSVGKALGEFAETGRLTGAEAEWAAEHRSGRPGAFSIPASAILGESRAILTTTPTGGPGGNLVATNLGSFIDVQRPKLMIESMGCTVLSGLTGNLDLPRLAASGTAGWVPEHTDATPSDPLFDKVHLSPNSISARYEISRRMMLQSMQLDTILRNDLGFLLRQQLDSAAIMGGGANQPTGILATSGVQVLALGANGAPITVDTAPTMIGMLNANNATGPTGFLTNTKVKAAASKLKDNMARPYGLGTVFAGEPAMFTNQVPSNLTKGTGTGLSALIYGVWSDLILGYWSEVDLVVNPFADSVASKGGAYLHAFLDCTVALRHPTSFIAVNDAVA